MSYLKGYVLNKHQSWNFEVALTIDEGLDNLILKGLQQLQLKASQIKETRCKRTGKCPALQPDHLKFGISTDKGPMWETNATIGSPQWGILDFGDMLPWSPSDEELIGDLKGPICEKNRCLFVQAAAGLVCENGQVGDNTLNSIRKLASSFRAQSYAQGKQCCDTIGELVDSVPLIHAELRSHAHDLCRAHHDKDNRALLRSTPMELNDFDIGIIAASPSFRCTVHIYHPTQKSTRCINLISYRNHMRLTIPLRCGKR